MAEAPGAVWKDISDPNRTSSGRKGGRMVAWLEEMRPVISRPRLLRLPRLGDRQIRRHRPTPSPRSGMYLTAVLRGCYPWRLAGIVLLQIFLSDRTYRKVADGAISWLGAGFRQARS